MVWRERYPIRLSGLGIGLCGLLIGCTTPETPVLSPPPPETPNNSAQLPSGPKKIYNLGEAFAIKDEITDVIITFSMSRTHEGEEFLKPEENHYWYYLMGTISNRSDEEFVISPDFYALKDDKKKTYKPSVRSHAIKNIKVLQGRIAPQSEQSAEIGFELPKGSKPTELSFDISNFTACNDKTLKSTHFCKPILINLKKQ